MTVHEHLNKAEASHGTKTKFPVDSVVSHRVPERRRACALAAAMLVSASFEKAVKLGV